MDNTNENNIHEKHEVTIFVNAREEVWNEKEISYEQVIVLAYGSYSEEDNIVYTVTYSRGEEPKKEGSLVKGQKVKVKKGMIFNVTKSDKS